jgi:hypothetical protein
MGAKNAFSWGDVRKAVKVSITLAIKLTCSLPTLGFLPLSPFVTLLRFMGFRCRYPPS